MIARPVQTSATYPGDIEKFNKEVEDNVRGLGQAQDLQDAGRAFLRDTAKFKYTYNFSWMGLPIIQCPQDIVAMQELIWKVKPDLIVEAGIGRGGSLIFYASMLEMMGSKDGKVVGIDIDIRAHNRHAIQQHPMNKRITLIEGSSTEQATVDRVKALVKHGAKVLVSLDSMHTHAHVLQELRLYSPLVSSGSYLVVFDTVIEEMPEGLYPERPWGKGNNPMTAVWEFMKETKDFEIDHSIPDKLVITTARSGFLRRK